MEQVPSDPVTAPVDDYANTGNSCPDLCTTYDVDVREFVVLACIRDTGTPTLRSLSILVGLSPTTLNGCIAKLIDNGLIQCSREGLATLSVTTEGLALLRKANRGANAGT